MRWYAALLVTGTVACVALALTVTLPVVMTLLLTAAAGLVNGESPAERVDGLITIGVLGIFWALWIRAWWRRHGRRIRTWYRRHARSELPADSQNSGEGRG